jgi:hypothetical protein
MHYTHVKNKETPMKTTQTTPTLEELRLDPEILGVMIARARRARSQAIGNAFLALLTGARKRLSPKPGLGKLITRMG